MNLSKPYYAVIFTNVRSEVDKGYSEMAQKMENLARQQSGFIDFESARGQIGIAVSYWESLQDIANWKANTYHLITQKKGISDWNKVRICLVEREYGFKK